jgi:hypothetical protein
MIHTLLLVVVFLGVGNKPKAQFTILHKNSLFCFFVCAKINTFAAVLLPPFILVCPCMQNTNKGIPQKEQSSTKLAHKHYGRK